jgi:hypothetical protein
MEFFTDSRKCNVYLAIKVNVKVKVKFAVEPATKGQREARYMAVLFL